MPVKPESRQISVIFFNHLAKVFFTTSEKQFSQINRPVLSITMVLQNSKTSFLTLIYTMLLKRLLPLAGKALPVKQSRNSSTQKLNKVLR